MFRISLSFCLCALGKISFSSSFFPFLLIHIYSFLSVLRQVYTFTWHLDIIQNQRILIQLNPKAKIQLDNAFSIRGKFNISSLPGSLIFQDNLQSKNIQTE